ncbi:MAG: tRNA epoxyqueuosine(34) reductase QueG [Alphaproteobacteria bacterium]|nr:tRNA epoxyqueuosine(34) reductase QueG [Alphaproteobacteria bacterium]
MTADLVSIRESIRAKARELGFDEAGFAPADGADGAAEGLADFLAAGHHGDMGYMARRTAARGEPKALWPEVRSVIVLAMNYAPADSWLGALAGPDRGTIAAYAKGRDYHLVMKSRLKALARWIARSWGAEVKVFVDTAPVMEKPLAESAGLGWQGKHTNLVSRRLGSWLFLGEVYTTLELPADAPEVDHCGSCRACLDACPTDAFPAPGRLDARRCISYLTIEHKGPIAVEFRAAMGNRIYGCDDCLAVCPWNKYARMSREAAFLPRIELTAPKLADLAALDDAGFRQVFSTSPIKRLGRDRFVRNVLIAIGNSGDPALAATAQGLLDDASPLVRGMAVWAASRLLDTRAFAALKARHAPGETDAGVLAEWERPAESARPGARQTQLGAAMP